MGKLKDVDIRNMGSGNAGGTGSVDDGERVMGVLSESDLKFFRKQGYVVLSEAVSSEKLCAVIDVIWEFLEMDRDNPEDWYKHKPYTRENRSSQIAASGMTEIYQHQALQSLRWISSCISKATAWWAFSESLGPSWLFAREISTFR